MKIIDYIVLNLVDFVKHNPMYETEIKIKKEINQMYELLTRFISLHIGVLL